MASSLPQALVRLLFRRIGGGSPLSAELDRFFGGSSAAMPIVSRHHSPLDLPNLQRAIDRFVQDNGAQVRTVGYASQYGHFHNSLRFLLGGDAQVCAAELREVDTGVNERMRCVENGIHLIATPDGKIAAHVRTDMMTQGLELEVIADSSELASRFLDDLRANIARANVYRGKVLSLECNADLPGREGHSHIRFHELPSVRGEDIVLPESTRTLLERNTIGFFRNAELLRKSGRSLKRGLLLHGKPGTGKTFTAKWLAQSLEGVTTILISGDQLALVKECCQIARMLAPALVILEDVDLIAGERDERRHPAYQVTLHQLMNEMDGLSGNAEVLFLLTTNRPDAIEGAIAARPGRVDQAIEFPLPDAACRRRLFALYGRGLELAVSDIDALVARTENASPAFLQELVRKAAMIAAEEGSVGEGGVLRVVDAHFETALREMLLGGGELTRHLLGFDAPEK